MRASNCVQYPLYLVSIGVLPTLYMKNDFEFLISLTDDFFKKSSVKDTLSTIYEHGIKDWEKWLQIEFAMYCKTHQKVANWKREQRYGLDKRMSKDKNTCAIDFWIRQRYKQSALGIEFKQHYSPQKCIKGMLNDAVKVQKVKYSLDDLRSIWHIGVHSAEEPDEVENMVIKFADHHGVVGLKRKFIHSDKIALTDFSFTIF
jgi:hypothetical protein